jgi:hypothetical protein
MSSNLAASVRARLSNQAKERKRPFQELLQYYGVESTFLKGRYLNQELIDKSFAKPV